jgi:cell division protein ZapA
VTQAEKAAAENSREPARVSVRILEKEYTLVCPYEERSALLDSAEFLNARMREVRDSGKVVGLDRIAVMVALNLANEYLRLQSRESKLEGEVSQRVKGLRERVENQLAHRQQLEL